MWEVFQTLSQGGVLMFVNLAVSVSAVTVVLVRIYDLWFKNRLSTVVFADQVVQAVDQGNYASAIQVCSQKSKHPLAAMSKSILLKADKSDREIERAYDTASARELPRFSRFTAYLPQAGHLAILVGLLGTIYRLIQALGGAQAEDAAAPALTQAIALALYNTFFGFAIAVFCAISFIILNARQTRLIQHMHNAMNRIRDAIMDRNRSLRMR